MMTETVQSLLYNFAEPSAWEFAPAGLKLPSWLQSEHLHDGNDDRLLAVYTSQSQLHEVLLLPIQRCPLGCSLASESMHGCTGQLYNADHNDNDEILVLHALQSQLHEVLLLPV